jgi:spermidine synthase
VDKPVDKVKASVSVGQRRYFYFTAAVTGAAIMIIEILGAKMLAPYVGTSHFVWTAQIAVTLTALASGYYAGGKWVDRSPSLKSLYLAILGAVVYLCVVVTQVERVAYFCLEFKLALGSLLASTLLFFIPLFLLAMAGPFLVRILTPSLQSVGGSVGRLTAVSTLGSVAGTVLIGYVLIPFLPNSVTMILTAVFLMLVVTGWFVIWGSHIGAKWMVVPALALGVGCGWATQTRGLTVGVKVQEIYRGNSNFGQMQVLQTLQLARRALINDGLLQGAYDAQTRQSVHMFSYMLHGLACTYATNLSDVLCIGLGTGIVPMQFAREGVSVDVVEINPAVVPLARQYFDFQPECMAITIGDGRQFLAGCHKSYDVIILDAFLGETSPSHLMTREAFTAMRRILRPDGVLIINCFGDFAPGRDFQVASLRKTLAAVFPSVRLQADGGDEVVNVFFVASSTELTVQRAPTFDQVHPACRDVVAAAFARVVALDPAHGLVLTDDYNPVEYYDAANREWMRRSLASYMREM